MLKSHQLSRKSGVTNDLRALSQAGNPVCQVLQRRSRRRCPFPCREKQEYVAGHRQLVRTNQESK